MARTRQYVVSTRGSSQKRAYGAPGLQMRSLPLPVPLTGGCQFIAGDPLAELKAGRDPHCGAERQEGSAYCETHHGVCWVAIISDLTILALAFILLLAFANTPSYFGDKSVRPSEVMHLHDPRQIVTSSAQLYT